MDKFNNLRKVQMAQLEMLDKVVEICELNDINYYLIGGTLIGAVRHKGFIPWDDDIDIAIPREDYEKFIIIAKQKFEYPFKVLHYTIDPSYRDYLLKITNENIIITENKTTPIDSNVFIDILPIDGIPDNAFMRIIYKIKLLYYRMLVGFTNIKYIRAKKRNLIESFLINFARFIPIGEFIDRTKIRYKIDKLLKKYKYNDCNDVGTIFGNYGFHEIVSKEYFGTARKVEFEGKEYSAPENIEKYLTHMYGDYMELPPKDKRVGHHIVNIKFKERCNIS